MTSQKQADANRKNAELSTGPKTQEGKAVSRMNAYKHGLTARHPSRNPEECEEFDRFLDALACDFSPQNMAEYTIVEQLTGVIWALRLVRPFEMAVLDAHCDSIEEHESEMQRDAERKQREQERKFRAPYSVYTTDEERIWQDEHREKLAALDKEEKEALEQAGEIEIVESPRKIRDYGGAWVRDANMGDALGKITRYEIHLYNIKERLLSDLKRMQEDRLNREGHAADLVAVNSA